jgi:hypothetical protein
MRRTLWRAVSVVFVLGLTLLGCSSGGPNRSQNPSSASGFNIDLVMTPNVLRGATAGTGEAQGGCGQVTAKVFDELGQLVDGAFVNLTTTLGRFPGANPGQEFVSVGGSTVRGIFDFPLCAKAERGTGTVTATVEDAVATILFTVF